MLTRANKRKLPGYEEELAKVAEKENKKHKPKPLAVYPGKYKYITEFSECAAICDELLSEAENSHDLLILGFDLEWPFSFKTGPGKTALMQICASSNDMLTYLFHIYEFKKLPATLVSLLSHKNVRIVGVNIKNDVQKLSRDFPGINKEPMLNNCVNSQIQAREATSMTCWSMAKLVEHFLYETVDKDKRVRMSKWHIKPLSDLQMKYAATDAWISLRLYRHLRNLTDELEEQENEDKTKNILRELV